MRATSALFRRETANLHCANANQMFHLAQVGIKPWQRRWFAFCPEAGRTRKHGEGKQEATNKMGDRRTA